MKYVFIISFYGFLVLNFAYAKDKKALPAIVVTAQKSEENIQKTPLSITAFDEVALEDNGISSLDDIGKFTPNLLLYQRGQQGLISPSIRGISANVLSSSMPVGLYVDGVPVTNSFGFSDALMDIERVEVLRGPQGSLYGRGSEAGVINIITKKPNNETRAKIFTKIGNEGRFDFGASGAGAILKDKLFMALSAKHTQKDGFIKNLNTGKFDNNKETNYGKVSLRFTPTDSLEFFLIGSINKLNNGSHDWSNSPKREIKPNFKGSSSPKTKTLSFQINYDINEKDKISSTTTYRKHHDKAFSDGDLTPKLIRHIYKNNIYKSYTEELKYIKEFERFKITSGLYLGKSNSSLDTKILSFKDPTGKKAVTQELSDNTLGIFANANYSINDNLSLTLGGRFDKEDKKMDIKKLNLNLSETYKNFSPKVAIDYSINKDIMTYLNISKGYRSGGFNPFAPIGFKKYNDESLISYEFGIKSYLFDKLILNSSIYYMDISHMQVEESPKLGTIYMTNAASATSKGVELELQAYLNHYFTLFANAAFNETKFDKFSDNKGKYDGNFTPFAPNYNFNIALQYRQNGYFARLSAGGYGKTYFDKGNKFSQKPYTLFDTKIGYEAKNFDIYFYVDNIFDKNHDSLNAYFNGMTSILKQGREFGIQAVYRF